MIKLLIPFLMFSVVTSALALKLILNLPVVMS